MIDWNVTILAGLLKQIQARRGGDGASSEAPASPHDSGLLSCGNPFDEVQEVIQLPALNATNLTTTDQEESISLDPGVVGQLEHYVTKVASMYCDRPFHNFEHASHVSMSVVKLLSRISDPAKKLNNKTNKKKTTWSYLFLCSQHKCLANLSTMVPVMG